MVYATFGDIGRELAPKARAGTGRTVVA